MIASIPIPTKAQWTLKDHCACALPPPRSMCSIIPAFQGFFVLWYKCSCKDEFLIWRRQYHLSYTPNEKIKSSWCEAVCLKITQKVALYPFYNISSGQVLVKVKSYWMYWMGNRRCKNSYLRILVSWTAFEGIDSFYYINNRRPASWFTKWWIHFKMYHPFPTTAALFNNEKRREPEM